jgi:cytochrome c-type biogenesis protein CcmH/NrfG
MSRTMLWSLTLAACLLSGCQAQQNLRPDSPAGNVFELQQRAQQAYAEGDWLTAERAYRDLTRQVPREVEPWFRLGNIYAHLEQPEHALAAYKEVLVRDPRNSKTWHNMGVVQLRQATGSFLTLEQVAEPDDPLKQRATQLLDAVSQLLEQDFDAAVEDDLR